MIDEELSEADKRQKELILYSLDAIAPLFKDDNVTDIWIDNGIVSKKEFGKHRETCDIKMTRQQCQNILVQIANFMNINIDYLHYPVLEGTIPYYDARITGVMKWTKNPFITIRKRPLKVFSIDDYVERGQCTKERAEKIKQAIKFKKNILVSGGTGSGKTTFTNAVIVEMVKNTPYDSFYIVEDNAELQCKAQYAEMLTIETEDAMRAVKLALRCTPDRIIFGEIRDGRVLWALLDAWNTGHPGGVPRKGEERIYYPRKQCRRHFFANENIIKTGVRNRTAG